MNDHSLTTFQCLYVASNSDIIYGWLTPPFLIPFLFCLSPLSSPSSSIALLPSPSIAPLPHPPLALSLPPFLPPSLPFTPPLSLSPSISPCHPSISLCCSPSLPVTLNLFLSPSISSCHPPAIIPYPYLSLPSFLPPLSPSIPPSLLSLSLPSVLKYSSSNHCNHLYWMEMLSLFPVYLSYSVTPRCAWCSSASWETHICSGDACKPCQTFVSWNVCQTERAGCVSKLTLKKMMPLSLSSLWNYLSLVGRFLVEVDRKPEKVEWFINKMLIQPTQRYQIKTESNKAQLLVNNLTPADRLVTEFLVTP